MKFIKTNGFTLLEVLIALSIMSIALTALLLATARTVAGTARLREAITANIVATQALTAIQLDLIQLEKNQVMAHSMSLFDQTWYWHVKTIPTSIHNLQRLEITVSPSQNGPFRYPLYGFRRMS